jgi:hypothetical protein
LSDKGHAVYADATYYKDTTVENDMTYNYPNTGNLSGWD